GGVRGSALNRRGELTGGQALWAGGWELRGGVTVAVGLGRVETTDTVPDAIPVPILYEDAHLAVVEKPAGMVAHPTAHWRGGTLVNALAHHFNRDPEAPTIRPGLVHRLDRLTSGLMVVAKSEAVLSRLTVAFHDRQVEKRYLAL